MAYLLRVPEVAAGATSVLLSEWLVEKGATLVTGMPIAVIETDKAVVEIEAEADAVLLSTLVEGGQQVDVGSPMALLGGEDETGADIDALLGQLGVEHGTGNGNAAPSRREVPEAEAESPSPGQDAAPQVISQETPLESEPPTEAEGEAGERRFVSPIARRLLKEAGIPADSVTGTGPRGRVVRRDVEKAIAAKQRPPAVAPAAPAATPASSDGGGSYTDTPHTKVRRAIASRLTASKQEIPHFYVRRAARIDALLALRSQLNDHSPVKLSVNDFILRSVAVAHTEVPDANVVWTDDAIRKFDHVDISVAIASERGLVTPVVRSVESSSISSVSASVKGFVELANAGRLQQRDLEGGSITVTNLGMYGVDEFSAIINPPQSAILAVGAGKPVVDVVDGAAAVVTAVNLVLSVDHRAIDGALAAQWMGALVAALENPLRLVV
jgi:pyruvate dehydrogenase E2 component (dihydrolipoamide acetyltransferase)